MDKIYMYSYVTSMIKTLSEVESKGTLAEYLNPNVQEHNVFNWFEKCTWRMS